MFKFALVLKPVFTIMFFLVLMAFALPQKQVSDIGLLDLKGNTVRLTDLKQHKATVIIFLSPECPLCQSYTLTINNLINQYQAKGIDFIAVIPTTDFSLKSINDYRITYKPEIKILRDEKSELVQVLHATITPEVFLLDKNAKTIYSGRIDNWAYELGKKRKVITQHDLKNAIEATLTGKPILVTKTKAIGCFIE